MNKQMVALGMTLFLLAGARQAVASVPLSINYSGELVETTTGAEQELTDKNGFFFVRLYASPTSTNALWARQYTVLLNKGKFNIEISENAGSTISGSPTITLYAALRLQATDPQSEALYIGVRPFDDDPKMEIKPRQRVVSVPFAMLANDVVAARRNFTVTNGLVSVKNLVVLKNAVFSNTVAMGTSPGTSGVHFASSPLFMAGLAGSQAGKNVQISKSTTVSGAATFSSGLAVTSLTSTAASVLNNGLVVNGDSTFSGGLTARNAMNVDETGTTIVGGTITPASSISISGSATITNLTALNPASVFPGVSMLDNSHAKAPFTGMVSNGWWYATNDCFVVASVKFWEHGTNGTKIATRFFASPSNTVGTGTLLADVGMGTKGTENKQYGGTLTASFILKSGEYLTWQSEHGAIQVHLLYRWFTYSRWND